MSHTGGWRRREELFKEAFEIARDVSPADLLRRVASLAAELAAADAASLVILTDAGEVQDVVTLGIYEERRRVDRGSIDGGVLAAILGGGGTVRMDRLGEDDSVAALPRTHRSGPFLGAPISLWGRVFGAICLSRGEGAPAFDRHDEEQVALLGTQVGIALDHARLLQEAHIREQALVAVKEVSQRILEGRETDDVLQLIAGWARGLVSSSLAVVSTPEPDGSNILQRVADGFVAPQLVGTVFPAVGSISGEVMRTRQPLLVEDVSADQRTAQPVVRLGGMGPALFVPLAVGDRVFGTLAVVNTSGGRCFASADVLLLQTFAAEAALALHYGQIRAELERLSLLEERERIAMDLHDGVIQALFVVGLSLQTAQAVANDPDEVATRLEDAVGSIDRAIRDLRDYIFGLQPSEIPDDQLERSLREVALIFQRAGDLTITVDVDSEAAADLTGRSADVIQAAREAVSNAVRHSGGDKLVLRLRVDEGEALLEVTDNGSGFDLHEADGHGLGLGNLRSRAEALGGALQIETGPGQGSAVRIRIPVQA